jgi:hypothetical protein
METRFLVGFPPNSLDHERLVRVDGANGTNDFGVCTQSRGWTMRMLHLNPNGFSSIMTNLIDLSTMTNIARAASESVRGSGSSFSHKKSAST